MKTAEEISIKCPLCGKQIFYYYDAYCTLSCRGANSNCKEHLDKLICGNCAEKRGDDEKWK